MRSMGKNTEFDWHLSCGRAVWWNSPPNTELLVWFPVTIGTEMNYRLPTHLVPEDCSAWRKKASPPSPFGDRKWSLSSRTEEKASMMRLWVCRNLQAFLGEQQNFKANWKNLANIKKHVSQDLVPWEKPLETPMPTERSKEVLWGLSVHWKIAYRRLLEAYQIPNTIHAHMTRKPHTLRALLSWNIYGKKVRVEEEKYSSFIWFPFGCCLHCSYDTFICLTSSPSPG